MIRRVVMPGRSVAAVGWRIISQLPGSEAKRQVREKHEAISAGRVLCSGNIVTY